MVEKYIIGIDGGSQSSKVVIFDLNGNEVSRGQERLQPMSTPDHGVVEHPGDDLWDSLCKASQKAMGSFPGNEEDIIGIGLCTIRFNRCLLKMDGTLASPAISWMDDRVSKPYEHKNDDVAYVTTSSGYITHRFTNEFKDTNANYMGMWPIDTDTWQWSDSDEVFDYYNIPQDMLFTIQDPGTILGNVTDKAAKETGIPANIPVIATANDKAVEALGSGIISSHSALVSLGTYIAGMILGQENTKNSKSFWTNFASIPGEYLYESNGIRRGMWTVSWFTDLYGEELTVTARKHGMSPEEFLNEEAAKSVPPGSDGLMTVLDWLPPADKPFKKGMMIGLDSRHTRAHMYQSILEGIAMTMKTNMDSMLDEVDQNIKEMVISGGGSNSDLMMQILSNVFGLPTKRNVTNGSASLGAAINVAVALNVYSTYEEATKHMVKVKDMFHPEEDKHAFYTRMNNEVYQHISAYTDGILRKSYSFFNS
ncbi:Sugar (pentulose or hexulose) kinase [Gracilibacillus orientalis]|uniref:Sugar (Pentulose or hexulose) kinase n=1 Tax=Gracilibacillus orientalis TaxID=334253 RepID=A0A1I4P0N7_9BACI|nr:FGGY family carbohydrate kinase [Gracilibacillus orientalis]SFM21394.1 Sugar (pentulose or hexulose) kinase [Gracilibacillus orientalis]